MSAGRELSFSTPLFGSHFCLEISKAAVKNFWFWKFPANRTYRRRTAHMFSFPPDAHIPSNNRLHLPSSCCCFPSSTRKKVSPSFNSKGEGNRQEKGMRITPDATNSLHHSYAVIEQSFHDSAIITQNRPRGKAWTTARNRLKALPGS